MALLLHYTGQDYVSRGLLNTELTPGSTSAIVGGCKTGKGFAFDGTGNSQLHSETALEDDVIAISTWFKLNVDSVSGNRFAIFSTAIGSSLKLTLEIYDVNRLRLLTYTSDNINTAYSTSNNAITSNIWYHVHALLDKTNRIIALFINGSLHGSISIAGSLDIVSNSRWFIGGRIDNRPFNGQICNLKVYNHVLSQKEINEDYKSLMLHYPLKNENEISPYIALNKVETFITVGSGFTQTQISKYHLHIIGSWGGTTSNSWPSLKRAWNQYVDGNTYTITFTYRLNSYANLSYVELRHSRWINDHQSGGRVYKMNDFPLGEWFTVTLTRKLDSTDPLSVNPLNPTVEIYVSRIANNQPSSVDLEIKDVYVTEGESILPYPITNTGSILDVSGFNRHITNLTNTVTLDSNSQVYSASLKNDGTQSLVGTCDLTDLNGLNEGSFSFRAFLTANNLSDQYVIYNMTALTGGNGILFLFRGGVVVAYFYGTRIQFNYRPTVDAWHHFVLVKTSNQIKVYVDNVNIYTVSAATSSTNFSNITSISSTLNGSSPINNGNVQDIRFYAKALTQADVTELYQTRQEIDNLANGYCYELVEGQSEVEMKANGQLYCDEVIENDTGTFEIVQNKTIKTKEIKEI